MLRANDGRVTGGGLWVASMMPLLGLVATGCGSSGSSGTVVPTQPLIVSTTTRAPITTTRSVNYWQWMPSYTDAVSGTETKVAALAPALLRVGGYNNDVNLADPFDDAAFDRSVAYARAIGAEPIIQVPLLQDDKGKPATPEAAAAMVTYGNVTKAYGIKYFAVGNEPDLYPDAGLPSDSSKPAIAGYTPAAYCASVRTFVTAMKVADPTIKIVGPDLSWKYQAGNANNDWLTPILTACGDLFDIVAIHRYPFEAKQATLTAAAGDASAFKTTIASVRGILAKTGYADKPLALTEMNVAYDATGCVLDASPGTVGSALWLASAVGTAIDLGLWTTAIWDIADTEEWALGLIGLPPGHTPRPPYYAYALFADHFGTTHVDVTSTPAGVTAFASRNAADDTTQIIAVNWNHAPAGLDVEVTGLPSAPAKATFALPEMSLAAIEVPDKGRARAWTYGEAQRRVAGGPVALAAGAQVPATADSADGGAEAGSGNGTAAGAGKVPGTGCRTDGGLICAKQVATDPAITTMGSMSGNAVSFGAGISKWGSYSYAAPGQTPPTAKVTADGTGLEIIGGFVAPVSASSNYQGFGLFFSSTSCLDVSAYTGVQFDFSGDLGGCNLQAGMNFSGDNASSNDMARGACVGGNSACYNPSAEVTSAALAATPAAPTIRVPFASFTGGMPLSALDPSTVVTVQWQLTSPAGGADGGGCAADFTVAKVAFYK